MGTDDLTLLDIYVGAMWDSVYCLFKAPAYSEAASRANLAQNAPNWMSYMERVRAHPKIAPVCMNLQAAEKHAERTLGWPEGEKCHLSLEVLEGVFPDLPQD